MQKDFVTPIHVAFWVEEEKLLTGLEFSEFLVVKKGLLEKLMGKYHRRYQHLLASQVLFKQKNLYINQKYPDYYNSSLSYGFCSSFFMSPILFGGIEWRNV